MASTVVDAGAALAVNVGERHVFRAAVLSIVLTLALGQNARLLCRIGCHPNEVTTVGCEHQDTTTSPRVAGDDNCNNVVAGGIAFVREDVRRGASAPDAQQTVAILRFRFAPRPTDMLSGHDPGQQPLVGARPLEIAIRI